jgi:hypothetical protein
VTTSPTVLPGGVVGGKSLLTGPVSQQQQLTAASIVKTVAITPQPTNQVSTTSATPILKTVTLTPQQVQAMSAARGLTGAALRDPKASNANPTAALRMVSPLGIGCW